MTVQMLGIDLGKTSCGVVGLDASGRVVLRRRVRRESIPALAAKHPGCVVAMEACCGAHHLGRLLAAQGHEVRLMSPEYVRPYVKAQKNDDRDAEAIAEAATRPTMRFVALKGEEQLDVQVLRRVRERLVGQRTSLTNPIRSILLERGIVVPQGRRKLLDALDSVAAGGNGLIRGAQRLDLCAERIARGAGGAAARETNPIPARRRSNLRRAGMSGRIQLLLGDLHAQWRELDRRIEALDTEFAEMARNDPAARRLATVPGIGVLNATAMVAAVGNAASFGRGRDLAAWLGLVPRQATTGGKPRLLGITKRGSTYLRKLPIQGARAALAGLAKAATPMGAWLRGLLGRTHANAVVVALAAKMARISWALLRKEESFVAGRTAAA